MDTLQTAATRTTTGLQADDPPINRTAVVADILPCHRTAFTFLPFARPPVRALPTTLALLLASTAASARADSIEFGATARCAKQPPEFELAAVVQHNGDTTRLSTRPNEAKQLKYGTHKLRCGIGSQTVSMTVHVSPPMNGHCMGAGHVEITSFRVGTHSVPIDFPAQSFNFKCLNGPMLVMYSVKRSGSQVVVERCSADDWTWESGYSTLACNEQAVPVQSPRRQRAAPALQPIR